MTSFCLPLSSETQLGEKGKLFGSLHSLQAIASHCHNLQGLNLLDIHVLNVEDHVLFWETLSNMKLTHLAIEFCFLNLVEDNIEKLICLFQKCWTIRGIQCELLFGCFTNRTASIVRCFPSLNYFYLNVIIDYPLT